MDSKVLKKELKNSKTEKLKKKLWQFLIPSGGIPQKNKKDKQMPSRGPTGNKEQNNEKQKKHKYKQQS